MCVILRLVISKIFCSQSEWNNNLTILFAPRCWTRKTQNVVNIVCYGAIQDAYNSAQCTGWGSCTTQYIILTYTKIVVNNTRNDDETWRNYTLVVTERVWFIDCFTALVCHTLLTTIPARQRHKHIMWQCILYNIIVSRYIVVLLYC